MRRRTRPSSDSLLSARRGGGQIEFLRLVQGLEDVLGGFGVRDLNLDVEALAARDVVRDALDRAVRDVADLAGKRPDLGHAQTEFLHDSGHALRGADLHEIPDAVLALEDYGEAGDDVAQKALRPEAEDGGKYRGPRDTGEWVFDEDADDDEQDYREDQVPQRVASQGDGGILALDARHGLLVEELPAPPAPPQHPRHPTRQNPVGEKPQEDDEGRGEEVTYKDGSRQVLVGLSEEISDALEDGPRFLRRIIRSVHKVAGRLFLNKREEHPAHLSTVGPRLQGGQGVLLYERLFFITW